MPEKVYKIVSIKLLTASGKTLAVKGLKVGPFIVHKQVLEDRLDKFWTFSVAKTKIDILHIAFPKKSRP